MVFSFLFVLKKLYLVMACSFNLFMSYIINEEHEYLSDFCHQLWVSKPVASVGYYDECI